MYEHKAVGPNLKTYFYYTNEVAEAKNSTKEVFVLATGAEGTGTLYNEVAEYLNSKGHAFYALDEWQYGKTGKVNKKKTYKNWGRKDSYYAAYNIHALTVTAKRDHPEAKICLIGNDFGAMLSLYLIKEFPEVIDRLVTIGWGAPRLQDFGFLIGSYIRKFFFYDKSESKFGHFTKNKALAVRFGLPNKYAWLSSDEEQIKKIVDAGYLDTAGTVGHYFYYYLRKILTPNVFMRMKNTDRDMPMLFISGEEDLTTLRGRKTKSLESFYKFKKFNNVNTLIVPGRHQVLFEKNRLEVLESILAWCETGVVEIQDTTEEETPVLETKIEVVAPVVETTEELVEIVEAEPVIETIQFEELQEAEDDLLIRTNR